jgi:hypothetical protein
MNDTFFPAHVMAQTEIKRTTTCLGIGTSGSFHIFTVLFFSTRYLGLKSAHMHSDLATKRMSCPSGTHLFAFTSFFVNTNSLSVLCLCFPMIMKQ